MRKTKAQRDQEWAAADRRVWESFRPRLEALQTFEEAVQLHSEAPPPSSPGRQYYSNLGFFLQGFNVPNGSSYTEKGLYLQFIQRLDEAGALKPGAGPQIIESLRQVMRAQGPYG